MRNIRLGVLGLAHGHVGAYCGELPKIEGVKLSAAWDDNPTRLASVVKAHGCEACDSPEAVVKRSDIDAVMIGIETYRHAEMVEIAAAAGKHILLQKPMALTLADCDRIIAAVEGAGIQFSMAWQMRQDPMNLKIKELIDTGVVGKVGVVRRRHCLDMLFHDDFKTSWHVDRVKNRGMWMDDASHAADFLLWLLGKPVSVTAEIGSILTNVTDDETGVALYKFESGALGILFNSSAVWAGENTCEVYGSKAVLIENHDDGPSTGRRRGIPNPIGLKMWVQAESDKGWQDLGIPLPDEHGARIRGVIRPFLAYLRDPSKPHATAQDGKVCIEMILGAYQASQEGRRIALPLRG